MILCFIDTETGDNVAWNCALLQVAFVLYDTEKKKFISKFCTNVKPFPSDPEPKQGALDVNRITVEDIETFKDPVTVQKMIIEELGKYIDKYNKKDKALFIAYNSAFDHKVMMEYWKKCMEETGDKRTRLGSFFHLAQVDLMGLCAQHMKEIWGDMESHSQLAVANELGIEVKEEELHDALADVKLMLKIYKKIGGFNEVYESSTS